MNIYRPIGNGRTGSSGSPSIDVYGYTTRHRNGYGVGSEYGNGVGDGYGDGSMYSYSVSNYACGYSHGFATVNKNTRRRRP